MKKKILTFVMAAAMVLAMPMASFAADTPTLPVDPIESSIADGGASVMSIAGSNVSTTRHTKTSGTVNAYATFTSNATRAVCTIYLQEKYNGSWRTATGLGTTSYTKTAYNTNSIAAGKTFTLISGKTYRAKVVFTGVVKGVTYTNTRYSGAF